MSETNSDDTNVLLLIPPYFFLANSSGSEENNSIFEFASSLKSTVIEGTGLNQTIMAKHNHLSYNYDIADINNQIQAIEEIKTDSEITTNGKYVNHSTPKQQFSSKKQLFPQSSSKNSEILQTNRSEGFLKEIDNYLLLDNNYSKNNNSIINVNDMSINDLRKSFTESQLTRHSLEKHNRLIENQEIQYQEYGKQRVDFTNVENEIGEPLISLSDIWGAKQKTGNNDTLTLHEERMRRQHCERSIQVLQARLLEFQQKISVALTVDKAKDDAIRKYNDNNLRLKTLLHQTENQLQELKSKDDKSRALENDLRQALELINKLQDQNKSLDLKCENLTRSTNEIREINKKQIQDLEVRLSNSLENEKIAHNEIVKCNENSKKLQNDLEIEKTKNLNFKNYSKKFEEEIEILKHHKSHLLEQNLNERCRFDKLEKEKLELHNIIESLEVKEKNLLRDIETQKLTLKSFYQKQLEDAVKHKLEEFQKQMDMVEENLKVEGKHRERILAERALKQMELINQKNEEELSLLIEKHNEEISLYRMQLINASKTIDDLKEKLQAYQSKRADIAERLHGIMEAQWQKALEIITSPVSSTSTTNPTQMHTKKHETLKFNKDIIERNQVLDNKSTPIKKFVENELFETPTTSRQSNQNNKRTENEYSEKLNEYIEMLLKTSPRDIDQLDEIIEMVKKSNLGKEQSNCGKTKPPWK